MLALVPPRFWYKKNIFSYILWPLSIIYRFIIWMRKLYYSWLPKKAFSIPIIVVGNIVVGGAGKTPLVIYLAEFLRLHGYNPGIISRGYGGKSNFYPVVVSANSKVAEVGDEALLMYQRTKSMVVVAPKRVAALQELVRDPTIDVVLSDDGLQHYALPRDIEIAVVDAALQYGNGFCLPAGPLREPLSRLQQVNFVIKNYNTQSQAVIDERGMVLEPISFYNIKNPALLRTAEDFKGRVIHAFAGIGAPAKFFQTLRLLGLEIIEHPYPDHYIFKPNDFAFGSNDVVVLTEKDGVKCAAFATDDFWCLKVAAKLSDSFNNDLLQLLKLVV